jgi:hypothetical protein
MEFLLEPDMSVLVLLIVMVVLAVVWVNVYEVSGFWQAVAYVGIGIGIYYVGMKKGMAHACGLLFGELLTTAKCAVCLSKVNPEHYHEGGILNDAATKQIRKVVFGVNEPGNGD